MSYHCRNTAYHTEVCCKTCWNNHPEATKGVMFLGSMRQAKIVKQEWIATAINFGFTQTQARFLYEQFKR